MDDPYNTYRQSKKLVAGDSHLNCPTRIYYYLLFPQHYADGRICSFLRVVDQWVTGIESKQEIIPSLKEGVYSQLLMDLSHQSNDSKMWVDVPSLGEFLAE